MVHKMQNHYNLLKKINDSNEVLNKTIDTYKINEIFISFNGGKDCTVLLDLFLKLHYKRTSNNITNSNHDENDISNSNEIICIYIQPKEPFEEVEQFVKECEIKYSIKLLTYNGKIKDALQSICNDKPQLKACLMGSRRSDPYCKNLLAFQETDSGWPKLMRVSPILDWKCDEIWEYLHMNKVNYCNLYNIGYTSIGDKTNTKQNPHLRYFNNETAKYEYKAASELEHADELERAGRL